MENNKIFGAVLLVAGIALATYGFNLQNSLGSQLVNALGAKDNTPTICIVVGAIASIIGIILLLNKSSEKKK